MTENVGVDENKEAIFSLFPNPAKNSLTIKLNGDFTAEKFTIFDQSGRNVLSNSFNSESSIDISTLENGTYFFKLGENSQPVIFVKN